jgi:hypothetical protein
MVLSGSFFTRTIDFREESRNQFVGTVYLRKQKGFPQTKLIAKLEEMSLLHTLSFAPEKYKKKEQPVVASVTEQKENLIDRPKEKIQEPATSKNYDTMHSGAALALEKRKTEIIRSISFTSDSLLLSIYDNGTVDGDTVSVVVNGNVVLAKKGLSENAIRATVHITPEMGDSLQLVMYAENLGAIPPNTGVLVIQDGAIRNEIRFAGDLQKSSAVVLKRKR